MTSRAVVTGGTRGIGEGVTRALVEAGWHVTATGVTDDEVAAFQARWEGDDRVTGRVLDVTDDAGVINFFGAFSELKGLANCAGVLLRNREYDIDVFQKVIDINLTGTMRTCSAAHALLSREGGSIVNTASMFSIFGGPHAPAYTASKGGVAQLTKALAGKWAADGIRVNAVAPGWIETEMTRPIRENPPREAEILGRTPMGRWGQPTEVGAAVAWLLSDAAGFVTGTVLPVDGGYAAI